MKSSICVAVAWQVLLLSFSSHLLLAAEGPAYEVDIEAVTTVDTVTASEGADVPGFKPHIRFPGLDKRADGSFRIWYNVGQTHGVPLPGRNSNATSIDHGQSWTVVPSTLVIPFTLIRPIGQTSYGFQLSHSDGLGFTTWQNARYLSLDGGLNWTSSMSSFNSAGKAYGVVFPSTHDDVTVVGDTRLMTAGAQVPGGNTFELALFASTDYGSNWIRRATIADYSADPALAMGEEGPNEADIILLENGNLLAVFRTGQPFPNCDLDAVHPSIFQSLSSDQGYTWSTPKMLGVAGSFPMLKKLDNGDIAMTYGRYGGKLMFADPTGTRWSLPTVIYDGPGSNYVHMRQADTGKYIYIYDQSSFYPPSWDNAPPECFVYTEQGEEIAHMKAAILDIQPLSIVADYDWLSEYHGDINPAALRIPWSMQQAGEVGTFQWADQGQDYLRFRTGPRWAGEYHGDVLPQYSPRRAWGVRPVRWIRSESGDVLAEPCSDGTRDYLCMDTGANGTARSLHFKLNQNSPWMDMDFEEGVVVHLRARIASGTTTQSSASIFAADGVHGYISLELTSNGINLEGSGGNGGQVTFTGINTQQWHDYTLVIAPDPLPGGPIRAKLYLDQDYTAPVLSQALMSSSINEIRFGDMTSINNGTWELDYLQFGHLADTQDLLMPVQRTLSYGLDAGISCGRWNVVDFSNGVVVDLRARVIDPATGEGAASLLLSDGLHGHVVLELMPDEVILQGLDGDDGQMSYGPLDMSQWHTWRLIIEPDPSAGGRILVRLFLDDDLNTPILTQLLGSAMPAEIRVGDLTGQDHNAANGIWDVDFLRFAGLHGESLPPMVRSDFDCDFDVDADDFGLIQRCLSGERSIQTDPDCEIARLDGDLDIDSDDINQFFNCFSGPNIQPPPDCDQ